MIDSKKIHKVQHQINFKNRQQRPKSVFLLRKKLISNLLKESLVSSSSVSSVSSSSFFRKTTTLPKYKSFSHFDINSNGIEKYAAFMHEFNPLDSLGYNLNNNKENLDENNDDFSNINNDTKTTTNSTTLINDNNEQMMKLVVVNSIFYNKTLIDPTYMDFIHVLNYFNDKTYFNINLFKTNRHLHYIVFAIFSFLLTWSDNGLILFGTKYKQFAFLTNSLFEYRQKMPIYMYKNEMPFIRNCIKILDKYFKLINENNNSNNNNEFLQQQPNFDIYEFVPKQLIDHFHFVFDYIKNDKFTPDIIEQLINMKCEPLLKKNYVSFNMRYITGEAACLKTTILKELKTNGWSIYSRGDIGSYSGKSRTPVCVAGLHGALDVMLLQNNTIGDRGHIDNPLWCNIMRIIDPQYHKSAVEETLAYFFATFNELLISFFTTQKVVIILDPKNEFNRERMYNRNTGGDNYRASIPFYTIAQFISYYMVARIFGWNVYFVPYKVNDAGQFINEIDQVKYKKMVNEICEYYGKPIKTTVNLDPLPEKISKTGKYSDLFSENYNFSMDLGIFK